MTGFTTRRFVTPAGLTLCGDIGGIPGAPTVVLMHGGGQTRRSWHGAAREFARAGYHVINLDARGHGDSDWPEDGRYSLGVLADDVRAVLGPPAGPVALVGASMGGVTAR